MAGFTYSKAGADAKFETQVHAASTYAPIGSAGASVTVIDNGDGTYTFSGAGVIDNGDGTFGFGTPSALVLTKAGADAKFATNWNVRTVTGAATAALGDYVLLDTTAGTFAVAAPAPTAGKTWAVKWVAGTAAPTLTGSFNGSPTFVVLDQGIEFISNGTAWYRTIRPALAQLPDWPATGDARYLASPTFTGTPTAPTQSATDNSTRLATTAYVQAALSSGYAAETQTLLNAMTVRPDPNRQAAINTFITALKTAGVWTLLDGLYVMAAHHSQAGLLNWVTRARDLTAINAPTFTTDRGYSGDASTQYLSNGTNITASANYTASAASLHAWLATDVANDNYFDVTTDSGNAYINPRNVANTLVVRGNYSGTVGGALSSTVSSSIGLSSWSRDVNNVTIYKNGNSLTSQPRSAEALTAVPLYFMRGNSSSQYSGRQIALAAYGSTLTGTQMAGFYNAALNYMTTLGVPS